ncbi:hypothetical protein LZ30DRAFT_219369 [Colletotrichum cereale]|nr:hypothetical protein LZ30DRAFT_219369 [Colletotrichum cereale]
MTRVRPVRRISRNKYNKRRPKKTETKKRDSSSASQDEHLGSLAKDTRERPGPATRVLLSLISRCPPPRFPPSISSLGSSIDQQRPKKKLLRLNTTPRHATREQNTEGAPHSPTPKGPFPLPIPWRPSRVSNASTDTQGRGQLSHGPGSVVRLFLGE